LRKCFQWPVRLLCLPEETAMLRGPQIERSLKIEALFTMIPDIMANF
jgi:hypothetical protein